MFDVRLPGFLGQDNELSLSARIGFKPELCSHSISLPQASSRTQPFFRRSEGSPFEYCWREIPRPACENAGLRDDAVTI